MTTGEAVAAFVGMVAALGPTIGAVVGFLVGLELVHFAVDLVRG